MTAGHYHITSLDGRRLKVWAQPIYRGGSELAVEVAIVYGGKEVRRTVAEWAKLNPEMICK